MSDRISSKLHNEALIATFELYAMELQNMKEAVTELIGNPKPSPSTLALVETLKTAQGQFSFLIKSLENSRNPITVKLKTS